MRTQERKEFNLYLGLGFYGTNLKYVDGAAPPPRGARDAKSAEYDHIGLFRQNRLLKS